MPALNVQSGERPTRLLNGVYPTHERRVPNGGAGPEPVMTRPDAALLAMARRSLAVGMPLTPELAETLLQDVVITTRQRIVAPGELLTAEYAMGICGPAAAVASEELQGERVPASEVGLHQAIAAFPGNDLTHSFATVRLSDDNLYLIDLTFRQFTPSNTKLNISSMPAEFLYGTPEGAALADALLSRGYVLLDDRVATLYGQALDTKHRPAKYRVEDLRSRTVESAYWPEELTEFFPTSRIVR